MKKYRYLVLIIPIIALFTVSFTPLVNYTKKNMSYIKEDPVKIGASYMTLNNPFYEVIDEEMRNIVEANGDILITLDPQLSVDKQIEQINYFIEQKCQVIIINPVDSKRITDALKKASAKGIKIIAIDTSVYEGNDFIDYTVVSDNYYAGVLCAKDMINSVDKANIVLLCHEAANSAVDRINGFLDTIKDLDNYHIVGRYECEGQLEQAMPIVEQCIKDSLNFDVIMCLNDPSALGAVAALQDNKMLDKVLVYGIDGSDEAKVLVNDGYMKATIAQYPKLMAKRAINTAYSLLESNDKLKEEKMMVNIITKDNIDEFSLEGWQ